MHTATSEEWRAIRLAGIGFRAAEHNRVEAMAIAEHIFGVGEECGIHQLDQHPELEVIALVRSG